MVMMTIWKSLVQSKLDYCSQLWCPIDQATISTLESIARHFTAQIDGLDNLDYWDRLQALRLYSQEQDNVNATTSSSYGRHCKDMWMATTQLPIGVLDGVALLRLGSTRQVLQLLSGKPERLACLYRVQDCSTFSPSISEI